MATRLLECVEVATGPAPKGTVIWMHGLGADGHDFEPAVPHLVAHGARALRFVFPHAPVRPVTLNGGMPMRAWYDIVRLNRGGPEDESGVRQSEALLHALVARENQRGIATEKIVLAGFSQGGAMALHTGTRLIERLAGIVGLSCYLPLADKLAAEAAAANRGTPIFMAHGSFDEVIELRIAAASRAALEGLGYAVEWHEYALAHSVDAAELAAVAAFLQRVL
jgi:phospholipase/carboxylesterase